MNPRTEPRGGDLNIAGVIPRPARQPSIFAYDIGEIFDFPQPVHPNAGISDSMRVSAVSGSSFSRNIDANETPSNGESTPPSRGPTLSCIRCGEPARMGARGRIPTRPSCSERCRVAMHVEEASCAQCGRTFSRRIARKRPPAATCSRGCAGARATGRPKARRVAVPCAGCARPVSLREAQLASGRPLGRQSLLFCSQDCFLKGARSICKACSVPFYGRNRKSPLCRPCALSRQRARWRRENSRRRSPRLEVQT